MLKQASHFIQHLRSPHLGWTCIWTGTLANVHLRSWSYDCCRGLAQQHAGYHFLRVNGYKADREVIKYLLKLWEAVRELPRFKQDHGRSFVFWLPHTNTFYDWVTWGMDQVCEIHGKRHS